MLDWQLLATAGTVIGFFISITWWLARQFSGLRQLVYDKGEQIIKKLEYHERHDDERFAQVRNDIWEIRLRNAVVDGKALNQKESPDSRKTRAESIG